jgi:hypothetical protein
MKYLVEAKMIGGAEPKLAAALSGGDLANGKAYANELKSALSHARVDGGVVRWIETCHCTSPLKAEKEELNQFFTDIRATKLDAQPKLWGTLLRDMLPENATVSEA